MGSTEMRVLNGRGIVVRESTDLGTEPILNLFDDFRLNVINLIV